MNDLAVDQWVQCLDDYRVIARVRMLAETLDYNHQLLNTPAMWARTRGKGVKVVILDTGRPEHDDIVVAGAKSFIPGYEQDGNGHSTHCGGLLAAVAGNGRGVAGIAPEASVYYGAVLGARGTGRLADIEAGIRWAVDEVGAHVISMSLGIPSRWRIKPLEDACNYANAHGVTIFAASGNEGGTVGLPAQYDSVIAVAAVNSAKDHAGFSNFGPQVDFAAGGVQVFSTYLNNGYAKLDGTSMACPVVAGVGALIIAEHLQRGQKLTPAEVKEHIERIAYDVGPKGFDQMTGRGIPVFTATEPPDPVAVEQPPAEHMTCPELTWKLIRQFVDTATKAAEQPNTTAADAIMAGVRELQRASTAIERAQIA